MVIPSEAPHLPDTVPGIPRVIPGQPRALHRVRLGRTPRAYRGEPPTESSSSHPANSLGSPLADTVWNLHSSIRHLRCSSSPLPATVSTGGRHGGSRGATPSRTSARCGMSRCRWRPSSGCPANTVSTRGRPGRGKVGSNPMTGNCRPSRLATVVSSFQMSGLVRALPPPPWTPGEDGGNGDSEPKTAIRVLMSFEGSPCRRQYRVSATNVDGGGGRAKMAIPSRKRQLWGFWRAASSPSGPGRGIPPPPWQAGGDGGNYGCRNWQVQGERSP